MYNTNRLQTLLSKDVSVNTCKSNWVNNIDFTQARCLWKRKGLCFWRKTKDYNSNPFSLLYGSIYVCVCAMFITVCRCQKERDCVCVCSSPASCRDNHQLDSTHPLLLHTQPGWSGTRQEVCMCVCVCVCVCVMGVHMSVDLWQWKIKKEIMSVW